MKWLIALIYCFFVLLPVVIGLFLFSRVDLVLTNLTFHNWADYGSYSAWVHQGMEGRILFKQLFSLETPNPRLLFQPFFLLAGALAWLFKISSLYSIIIMRLLGVVVLVASVSKLLGYLKISGWRLLITQVLLFFGSGIGWIILPGGVDLAQSESSLLFSVYASVLNPVSLGLLVICIYWFINESAPYRRILFSLTLILLIFIHLYDVVVLFAILSGYTVLHFYRVRKSKGVYELLGALIIATLCIVIQMHVLLNNAPLGVWAFLQTHVPAPSLWEHLGVYSLLYLFGFIGIVTVEKRESYVYFMVIWIIVQSVLIFNPITSHYQQKFSLGLFIPLGILAADGIYWLLNHIQRKIGRYVLALFLFIILVGSNIFVVVRSVQVAITNPPEWVISQDTQRGLQFLDNQCPGVVLAAYRLSNRIPGYTGCSVYLGHYDQTVNSGLKSDIVRGMLSSAVVFKDPLLQFLQSEGIDYVVVDSEVRSWGGLDVINRSYLNLVYENTDIQIYAVVQ